MAKTLAALKAGAPDKERSRICRKAFDYIPAGLLSQERCDCHTASLRDDREIDLSWRDAGNPQIPRAPIHE
jgi:hypothetical protein